MTIQRQNAQDALALGNSYAILSRIQTMIIDTIKDTKYDK